MIEKPEFGLHPNAPKEKEKVDFINKILQDYWICLISREASLLGRREVLTGKAKFGIFGGGKELPQVALSRFFEKGDHRAGYYRDQTIAFALGISSLEDFFSQLYADSTRDPFSKGRQMNSHFATPYVDQNSEWTDHMKQYNISSDISCTGGQMARAMGLAHASKLYRELDWTESFNKFSNHGNEVCFATIGDASTSEGIFWETINAAAITKIPLVVSVWDDGYGISVPLKYQTVKQSISKALNGFVMDENGDGIYLYEVNGWDYPSLINVYDIAVNKARKNHIPAIIHVKELTQPQGHSTSGSHERYKSEERLQWEKEHDCVAKFEQWILENEFITQEILLQYKKEAKIFVKKGKKNAWDSFKNEAIDIKMEILEALEDVDLPSDTALIKESIKIFKSPTYAELIEKSSKIKIDLESKSLGVPYQIENIIEESIDISYEKYHTDLIGDYDKVSENVPAEFSQAENLVNGYQVLNQYFEQLFSKRKDVIAFGEDVGNIGDVNQGLAGLQAKFGETRIFDTGIREWSIIGQALGMAMRGFRPIAEIQYLDYIFYAMSVLTDDMASLRYRSGGQQQAPAIIRTRGHRLEGIWHSGSPLGVLINALRGMHVCVPRNMTQAVGMYNTLLAGNDPGLVIEVLNSYRLKENLPTNLLDFKVPLGIPDVLIEGNDITIVTYGALVKISKQAIEILHKSDIYPELIDVQTLLPFDVNHIIAKSIAKTSRVLFVDEDVPGGASAYMLQKVLEVQDGYFHLDAKPRTLSAHAHRPPFGSDGDYFSKPNLIDIINTVKEILFE